MRKEDKIIIIVIISIGMFSICDIVRRVYMSSHKKTQEHAFVLNNELQTRLPKIKNTISDNHNRKNNDEFNSMSPRLEKNEVKIYSKERGEYIPLREQKRINKEKQLVHLADERYREYIKNCILEKFGDSYKTDHSKAQIFLKINKSGYVEAYSIYGVVDSDTRKYSDSDSTVIRKKLEKAFISASPFQQFPPELNKDYIVFSMTLGCNKVGSLHGNSDYEPVWEYKINQVGLRKNPKKVEDTKLLTSYINLQGRNSQGHINYSKWIPAESINLTWKPPLTQNSHVVVVCPLEKGKLGTPRFEKKSEFEGANRAALDAIKKALIPSSSGMEKFENITVLYNFEVK